MLSSHLLRRMLASAGAMVLVAMMGAVNAQEFSSTINVTAQDHYMASLARNARHHGLSAHTPAATARPRKEVFNMHSAAASAAATAADPAADAGGIRYPGDLEYQGGPTLSSMRNHLIYVNLSSSTACSTVATCWGNPRQFLSDLGQSNMIHIVDQYVGANGNGRYTVSNHTVNVNYPDPLDNTKPYTDADMTAIVHAVVSHQEEPQTGYENEYHIFLVPGQQECFDSTFSVCYSPFIPASWIFCAYHGSADFPDIGHVIYSVEPYQNVFGCSTRPNGAHGQLADSTNDVLSHETFESITDPDLNAWWNSIGGGMNGEEIGDECVFLSFDANGNFLYSDASDATLNGRSYIVQPEYDNAQHGCTTMPP